MQFSTQTGVPLTHQHNSNVLTYPSGKQSAEHQPKSVMKPVHNPLQARLSMRFGHFDGVTRLVEREHYGPLLIQKPLYPEGRGICHAVIIHPPGGVVGGDELAIAARVDASAKAQITTPGAAKWYKANGFTSHQEININVAKGGALEWVPQETIFYNHSNVKIDHQVALEDDAVYVGCEILCFGRTAYGETFDEGQIKQRTRIIRNGKMIWLEQICLKGENATMKGALALSGYTVCATLLLTGKTIAQPLIDLARLEAERLTNKTGQVGISQLKSVVVVRYLGHSSEVARQVMLSVWGLFRPEVLGYPAIVPRMWTT
ncbi:MAG TPA: urease accessory protein UreD [Nitrosomonas sp.]|nr:urease accessory protein UreD [Nitrosomonas sp.]HMW21604.1 urease accessory protein UreD [Nitrosomonas sp.]HMW69690.1 urease accessory protein UreD [Nitrosomonas sp.]HMY61769.1 urease accessory protein UreD [Nitrosomonas sp.]HMY91043.1 urease accessory protein UreD [Nitrosomonas sp.]